MVVWGQKLNWEPILLTSIDRSDNSCIHSASVDILICRLGQCIVQGGGVYLRSKSGTLSRSNCIICLRKFCAVWVLVRNLNVEAASDALSTRLSWIFLLSICHLNLACIQSEAYNV